MLATTAASLYDSSHLTPSESYAILTVEGLALKELTNCTWVLEPSGTVSWLHHSSTQAAQSQDCEKLGLVSSGPRWQSDTVPIAQ